MSTRSTINSDSLEPQSSIILPSTKYQKDSDGLRMSRVHLKIYLQVQKLANLEQ
jgi:hypothetical protein